MCILRAVEITPSDVEELKSFGAKHNMTRLHFGEKLNLLRKDQPISSEILCGLNQG